MVVNNVDRCWKLVEDVAAMALQLYHDDPNSRWWT
jgi:hypothetical protein